MFSPRVTLASSLSTYNLLTLVTAINPANPPYAHQLVVLADKDNSSGTVFIGDASVSSTHYGIALSAGDSMNYFGEFNGVGLENIYLKTDTNGYVVNIQQVIL